VSTYFRTGQFREDNSLLKVKERNNTQFLTGSEITNCLCKGIKEEYRADETQKGFRRAKSDVIKKVVEMYPDVQRDKAKNGYKSLRLILTKSSQKIGKLKEQEQRNPKKDQNIINVTDNTNDLIALDNDIALIFNAVPCSEDPIIKKTGIIKQRV